MDSWRVKFYFSFIPITHRLSLQAPSVEKNKANDRPRINHGDGDNTLKIIY